jgi:hypothetical protein
MTMCHHIWYPPPLDRIDRLPPTTLFSTGGTCLPRTSGHRVAFGRIPGAIDGVRCGDVSVIAHRVGPARPPGEAIGDA